MLQLLSGVVFMVLMIFFVISLLLLVAIAIDNWITVAVILGFFALIRWQNQR